MSTPLYTSQTISSPGGQALQPAAITLTNHLVSLHVRVSTPNTLPTPKKGLQLVIAATPFTVATADAPTQLEPTHILYAEPKAEANGVVYFKTAPIVAEGLNLHAWINADDLGADVTLDAEVEEIA